MVAETASRHPVYTNLTGSYRTAQILRRCAAIGNSIDHARLIVRHENRPVRHNQHVHGAPPILFTLQPTFGKNLLPLDFIVFDYDAHQAIADFARTIPRAMFRYDNVIPILCREHVAGIETDAQRGHMGTQLRGGARELPRTMPGSIFRIREVALVAIRIPEMHTRPGCVI